MRAGLGLREPLSVPKSRAVTTFSYVTFTSAVAVCHTESWQSEGIRWKWQRGVSEGGQKWLSASCTAWGPSLRCMLRSSNMLHFMLMNSRMYYFVCEKLHLLALNAHVVLSAVPVVCLSFICISDQAAVMSCFSAAITVKVFRATPSVKTGIESEITHRKRNMSKPLLLTTLLSLPLTQQPGCSYAFPGA